MRQAEDLSESQCSTGYVTLAATLKVRGNNSKERVAEEVMDRVRKVLCAEVTGKMGRSTMACTEHDLTSQSFTGKEQSNPR